MGAGTFPEAGGTTPPGVQLGSKLGASQQSFYKGHEGGADPDCSSQQPFKPAEAGPPPEGGS